MVNHATLKDVFFHNPGPRAAFTASHALIEPLKARVCSNLTQNPKPEALSPKPKP